MRRAAALLLSLLLMAAHLPAAFAEALPEQYPEWPEQEIIEAPPVMQEEPAEVIPEQPAPAAEPAAGGILQPLQIVSAWYESSTVYVGQSAEAVINFTATGMQPGVTYTADITLTPVGSKYKDKPQVFWSQTFIAAGQTETMQIPIAMSDSEYIGVPYGLSLAVTGANGQHAESRQSVSPLTVTAPSIRVTLEQEARQQDSDPIVLDVQINVRDVEPGGLYSVRTSLLYGDTGEPVALNGEALEDEQELSSPLSYLNTYAAVSSFTVPENLVAGRDLRAKVLLFRDGIPTGVGRSSGSFYVHDMDGNVRIVPPTKSPEQQAAEYQALAQEEREALEQAEEQQRLEEQQAQELREAAEAHELTDTIITFAVLGAILAGLWIWYRKRKKEGYT